MPRYDYKCPQCDLVFEQQVSLEHITGYFCPKCGVLAIRQPSAPAFTIKGKYTAKTGYSE